MDKSTVVNGIVQAMRESCPSGGFLKSDPKRKDADGPLWLSIGGRETREKVSLDVNELDCEVRECRDADVTCFNFFFLPRSAIVCEI